MKKHHRVIFTVILLLISFDLFGLYRDYKSNCEEDNRYQHYYNSYCLSHASENCQEWLSSSLAICIPAKGPQCCKCEKPSIYLGYLDLDFQKYRLHFIHQLKYCKENSQCHCY